MVLLFFVAKEQYLYLDPKDCSKILRNNLTKALNVILAVTFCSLVTFCAARYGPGPSGYRAHASTSNRTIQCLNRPQTQLLSLGRGTSGLGPRHGPGKRLVDGAKQAGVGAVRRLEQARSASGGWKYHSVGVTDRCGSGEEVFL